MNNLVVQGHRVWCRQRLENLCLEGNTDQETVVEEEEIVHEPWRRKEWVQNKKEEEEECGEMTLFLTDDDKFKF